MHRRTSDATGRDSTDVGLRTVRIRVSLIGWACSGNPGIYPRLFAYETFWTLRASVGGA